MGFTVLPRSLSFDNKTAPEMNPMNAGNKNVNVQLCTSPIVPTGTKETKLTSQ
jgi:hypothetical protein